MHEREAIYQFFGLHNSILPKFTANKHIDEYEAAIFIFSYRVYNVECYGTTRPLATESDVQHEY